MSQQLELPDGTFKKLQAIAEAQGIAPEEWIEAQVSEASAGRPLSEVLKGHIGILDSGDSAASYRKDEFDAIVSKKFEKHHL